MMKNIFYIASFALLLTIISCETKVPDPWMSSTSEVDGNWMLRYDHSVYGIDPFGVGYVEHSTYNTSDNNGTEIWLDDVGHFWPYKVRIPVDLDNLTFGSVDTVYSDIDSLKVLIRNGKIIKDAITMPSTTVVDSMYYEVWFEDLAGATGIASDTLYVAGYRKTGFPEDLR